MHIKNEIFYHIHRENQHSGVWVCGSKINITTKQLNTFNLYYEKFYPTINMGGKIYPLLAVMDSILKEEAFIENKESARLIINQLHDVAKELAIYLRESVFEEVRSNYFVDLPSRKSCIWVFEKDAIEYWYNAIKGNKKIFKLELTGVIHKADQRHLNEKIPSCEILRENAFNYWTGSDGKNEIEQEILFEGVVKVLEEYRNISELR